MSEEIKYITIKEFRERGYLQELNRQFLHPLGMALEVRHNDDGTEALGGVWDYRDDPEGMRYEGIDLEAKAGIVLDEWMDKSEQRMKTLGYVVQPVDDKGERE